MYATVTYVSEDRDIPGAVALGRSVKIYSQGEVICLIQEGVTGIEKLQGVFDQVIRVKGMYQVLGLDKYEKILCLNPKMLIISRIDPLFLISTPASIPGHEENILMVSPSRFAEELFRRDTEDGTISGMREFFSKYGYKWNSMDKSYFIPVASSSTSIPSGAKILFFQDRPWESKGKSTVLSLWSSMYKGTYITSIPGVTGEWRVGLREHLLSTLTPILGPRVKDVLNKYSLMYEQCFISKGLSKEINYDLLEAYGDRLLSGQYIWLLLNTPGIVNADQVTKISFYFQDRYRLEEICDYLGLGPYILLGQDEKLDVKPKSDVIEALIAAIGISWQRAYESYLENKKKGIKVATVPMDGNQAIKVFVFKVFKSLFKIDPEKYSILYEDPSTTLREQIQELRLNRNLLGVSPPQQEGGEILITLTYDGTTLGVGRASLKDRYRETAIKLATKEAYRDALNRNILQTLVK